MKKILSTISICFLILALTSCKGIAFENKKIAKAEELPISETMIFVAEEKNKYESRFGSDIWNLKSGDGNLYFKDYVVSNVKSFVEKLMRLKLIANDINIILGSTDIANIRLAADEYYQALSGSDVDYIGCEKGDVLKAFTDYHIARLTIDNLSKNATSELSISEAKVIKVQYIVFDSLDKAKEVKELLNAKGASFSYYAKTRSEDTEIEMIIKRGDEMSTKFPELFYLSTGQVSDVLQNINKYYIFKCIDDYMVDETEERRIEILKTMKNNEFNINYSRYEDEYTLKSNSAYWRDIDLSKGKNCTIYKFEEIYYKYFPKSIK